MVELAIISNGLINLTRKEYISWRRSYGPTFRGISPIPSPIDHTQYPPSAAPPSGSLNCGAASGCDRGATGGGDSGHSGHARPPVRHHHRFFAMKIEITSNMTVAQLQALIAGADVNTTVQFVRPQVVVATGGECWCGCGGKTKAKFVPGHDARFHGLAKKVARGQEPMPESFVHAAAEADFMKWHDAEILALEAKGASKAAVAKAVEKVEAAAVAAPSLELDPESDEYKELMALVS